MEDHFVPIYDWMLELGLKPGELIAFAVIYSFWKKDGGWFHGSASYLAKCIGVKKNETVYKTLASLVKKGMVEKRERWEKGEKFCDYQPVRKTDTTIIDLTIQKTIKKKLIIKKSTCRWRNF